MIDLDHFKQYNDRYGHVAGDTCCARLAALMVSNIRGQDLVARLRRRGVLPGHARHRPGRGPTTSWTSSGVGGREATSEFGVTLSAGLTSWDGIEDTASFIERADQALYRAKETGRNRVVSIQAFTES